MKTVVIAAAVVIVFLAGLMIWVSPNRRPGAPPSPTGPSGDAHVQSLITKESFGEAWPLTVSRGELGCRRGEVTFIVVDDRNGNAVTYAVNAKAKESGHRDISEILADNPKSPGTKKDIGPLIDRGLKLCQ
jgi:hypothetical protein